ncbi:hypothetical protein K1719_021732 [Acacia pycnantha]|nr:hypothetical protein K1719_021732 [Acacia pycnantha]
MKKVRKVVNEMKVIGGIDYVDHEIWKPKLSRKVFFMTFMCGLFGGTLFQGLQMESLVLSSATFVSASFNLIPAITFLMALPFGLESLNLGEAAGWAKMVGTIAGIGGAMIMTFVKGPRVHIFHSHMNIRHHPRHAHVALSHESTALICAIASCFSYAIWLIIQGVMSKTASEYPSHLTNTALMSTMAAIQSTAFGLCVERDWRHGSWVGTSDFSLLLLPA